MTKLNFKINPPCPNCKANWDVKTGCDRCGLTPDDIAFNPSNQQSSFWGMHNESEEIARLCEYEDYFDFD